MHPSATLRASHRQRLGRRLLIHCGFGQLRAKLLAHFQYLIFDGRQVRHFRLLRPVQQGLNQALGFGLQFGFQLASGSWHGAPPHQNARQLTRFSPPGGNAPVWHAE
jgi:hypothetical protein